MPSLRPYPTPLLAGTGVATNAIYVQDLAVWLPLAAVAALWLRRRQARGGVVVTAVLVMWVIEAVSVAVDQWFGVRADPTFVAMPFLIVTVEGASGPPIRGFEEQPATLGARRIVVFRRSPPWSPHHWGGAGACWRAPLGKFGATITFAAASPAEHNPHAHHRVLHARTDPDAAVLLAWSCCSCSWSSS